VLTFGNERVETKKGKISYLFGGTESEFPPGPFAWRPITPFPLV
jgi:hypothetical protein